MRIEAEAQPAVKALEGVLARGASRFGSRVVASSATCRLSFGQLRRDADEVRRRLRRRDGRAAVAAVMLDGSARDLVAIYGVLLAGWHLVALREGADPVLEGLEPDAVVTRGAVRLCSSCEPEGFQRELLQRPEPHVLVTSSGSTNRATSVGFSLRRVCERASVESSKLRSDDVVAIGGSAHGSLAGITLALAALERGARLAFVGTGSSPADTIALGLGNLGVTRWSCSATLLAAVLAHRKGEDPVPGLRRIEVRGEELSPPLAGTALQAWPGAELWHTYGLTESGQGCSWRVTVEDVRCRSFVPIGSTRLDSHLAVDGGQILITDGRPPALVGGRGRTACRGGQSPTLATGDAGWVHTDGTVEYRGRIGERLAAADGAITPRAAARRVMRAFPQTHAAGAAGIGVVCMSADRSLDAGFATATREWGFPVVRLEDPPRSSSGKLDRAALETMLRSHSAEGRRARRAAHEQ